MNVNGCNVWENRMEFCWFVIRESVTGSLAENPQLSLHEIKFLCGVVPLVFEIHKWCKCLVKFGRQHCWRDTRMITSWQVMAQFLRLPCFASAAKGTIRLNFAFQILSIFWVPRDVELFTSNSSNSVKYARKSRNRVRWVWMIRQGRS